MQRAIAYSNVAFGSWRSFVRKLSRVTQEWYAVNGNLFPAFPYPLTLFPPFPPSSPILIQTVTCTAETLENKDSLKLWVQPAAAATAELATLPDGSATPSIVELDVRVESYLDEERVSGNLAVDEVMKPCE